VIFMRSDATGYANDWRGRRHEEWVMERTVERPGGGISASGGLARLGNDQAMNRCTIDLYLNGPRPVPQKHPSKVQNLITGLQGLRLALPAGSN
jgi:hypothetical protein